MKNAIGWQIDYIEEDEHIHVHLVNEQDKPFACLAIDDIEDVVLLCQDLSAAFHKMKKKRNN